MKSNSNGIDILTYAAAVSKAKKYTDSQTGNAKAEIDTKADKSDLGGLKFKHISESEYESLETKDDCTVYFIA